MKWFNNVESSISGKLAKVYNGNSFCQNIKSNVKIVSWIRLKRHKDDKTWDMLS